MTNFFTKESLQIHQEVEQLNRQEKLLDINVTSIDKENASGILGGRNYQVSLSSCTCNDFKARHLPCKHMYCLAMKLGLYKSVRNKRTTNLIADFSSGYASGWKFAVPTCFRNSLDIKLMPLSTGMKDSNGKFIFKNEWTQGNCFSFNVGATFYNDKIAYEVCWAEALQKLKYCIQIQQALSPRNSVTIEFNNNQILSKATIIDGSVVFNLYKPCKDNTKIELINTYQCLQNKLVSLLKTGRLETSAGEIINFF